MKTNQEAIHDGDSITALFSLGFSATTASANEVEWTARTVEQVKTKMLKQTPIKVYKIFVKWGTYVSVISEATGASLNTLVQVNEIQMQTLLPRYSVTFLSKRSNR